MAMVIGPIVPPSIKLDSGGHLIPARGEVTTDTSYLARTAQTLWDQKMSRNSPDKVISTFKASTGG